MADPKKSYNDIITWAKGTSNDIIAKQLATARTISITNNSGTSLASGTFNGTGNLTLKLPATVGIDISGNAATATSAATAERADLVRLNGADSEYPFSICLGSASVAASPNFHALYKVSNTNSGANSGLSCIPGSDVAAGTEGITTLIVGNGAAKTSAANRTGHIRIYGNGVGYTTIKPGYNSYNNIALTLPATSGTIALTSDAPLTGGDISTVLTVNSFPYTATHTLEHLMISTTIGDSGYTTYYLNGLEVGAVGGIIGGKGTAVYDSTSFILRKNDVVSLNTTKFLQQATTVILID